MDGLPSDLPRVPSREDAVRATGLLDSPAEPQFDRFTRLVCRWLEVPIALVTLVDSDRQFFKSAQGLAEAGITARGTPLSHSICRLVVEDGAMLAIDDAHLNERVRGHPAVTELGIRAYLGTPLTTEAGAVLGSLCAIDRAPRQWTEDDRATLVDLAALVMTEIGIRGEEVRRVAALEAEVRLRTASLQKTIGEMEEFSYMVSHDLRAPLRRIKCYAEILSEDLAARLTEAEAESLRRIFKSTVGMEELLNAVLPILRLARLDVQTEFIDLDTLVRYAMLQRPKLMAVREAIVIEPLGQALGQPILLEQVFALLLENAVKFVPVGARPQIRVHAEPDGDFLRIWVRDKGIGIAPEYQEKIFSVFSRLHAEAAYPGNGLGLNTVRKIMKRLNGDVGLISDGSNGSAFWIRLPLIPAGGD
jgi:signal transduction histidine kinase